MFDVVQRMILSLHTHTYMSDHYVNIMDFCRTELEHDPMGLQRLSNHQYDFYVVCVGLIWC